MIFMIFRAHAVRKLSALLTTYMLTSEDSVLRAFDIILAAADLDDEFVDWNGLKV